MSTALVDDLIGLRRYEANDLPALHAATRESLEPLCAWMTWCRPDYSAEDSKSFITRAVEDWETDRGYNFAIVKADNGDFLGSISLNHVNRLHNSANIGYWVRKTQSSRGVASRALQLISQFGFQQLRLNRLEIVVPHRNVASQRVAQKAGASFEGILRERLFLNGTVCDAIVYSLIRSDLKSNT